MKIQKCQSIFILILGIFWNIDSSEIDISILECNIIFIQMNSSLINKVYMYDKSHSTRELVYYFEAKNEHKATISSTSSLQKLISKKDSNSTHIKLDFPQQPINYSIEILFISQEGSTSTIQTSLHYKSNNRCFLTGTYNTQANILNCSMLFIEPHPKSRVNDQIYIYDKNNQGKKTLIYYFNTKDGKRNVTQIIDANLSNSTHMVLVRPVEEQFYKTLLILIPGVPSNLEINLFYDNNTGCFKRVSDYMDLSVDIKDNIIFIIPDFKIRIFDLVYLYDITSLSKRVLVYFYELNTNNRKVLPNDIIIDLNSSNATQIKLIRSTKEFHKIEITVVSQGFVSRLETELFFDSKTKCYSIISVGETKIFGVVLDPIEPVSDQALSVNLKYSLKDKHFLSSLYFQAMNEISKNPRINICMLGKENEDISRHGNCNPNTIWAKRVKSNFHNISTMIKFEKVLPIDNNYTFIWNLSTVNKDDDNDSINVIYYFNITVNVKDQITTEEDKNGSLLEIGLLILCLILIICFALLFLYRRRKKPVIRPWLNYSYHYLLNKSLK